MEATDTAAIPFRNFMLGLNVASHIRMLGSLVVTIVFTVVESVNSVSLKDVS